MFLNRQSNFRFIKKSINLIVNSLSKINFYYQKNYFKSDMEKNSHTSDTEVSKILGELNISESNMPSVPIKGLRYER